jgi:hypothetical protein
MLPLESEIALRLKGAGFSRNSRTWRRASLFSIQVVNLQRGFGEQLHVNLGVYLRLLGDETTPLEHHCHVRARLERICPPDYFEAARSLEASSHTFTQAVEALMTFGIAWLDALSNKDGLCAFIKGADATATFIHQSARALCAGHEDA